MEYNSANIDMCFHQLIRGRFLCQLVSPQHLEPLRIPGRACRHLEFEMVYAIANDGLKLVFFVILACLNICLMRFNVHLGLSLSHQHLGPDLFDSFANITLRILGDT